MNDINIASISQTFPMILPCLLLALVISSPGFYRVVYFISTGYAFAIAGMSVLSSVRFFDQLTWISILQHLLLLTWGLRLGIYLIQREYQASYRGERQEVHQRSTGLSLFRKILIWVGVSLLYFLMYTPAYFRFLTPPKPTWGSSLISGAGLLVMASGLVLEMIADRQKSSFKSHRHSPDPGHGGSAARFKCHSRPISGRPRWIPPAERGPLGNGSW